VVRRLHYEVVGSAATAERALELARQCQPDIVLMDVNIKGLMDGIETACALRDYTDAQIVFLTGACDPESIARMEAAHPAGIVLKPFRRTELASKLARAGQIRPAWRCPELSMPV
jgi:DNA-binding NarL/FixJ family response regulator